MHFTMKRSRKPHKRETGKVGVSLLLPEDLVNQLQHEADKEHRSRNLQAEYILSKYFATLEEEKAKRSAEQK